MHVRQQIADRVLAQLAAGMTTATVAAFESANISDSALPALVVRMPVETVDYDLGTMSKQPMRIIECHLQAICKVTNNAHVTLNSICEDAEQAIYIDRTFNNLAVDVKLGNTEIELNSENDLQLGSADMTFLIFYRTTEGVPQTAIS